ncbi:MAG: glycosyltransferase [Lachnospiraceae bacterium]|nr:glycosyltransferase [Lachnospiraceae bacterium]
MREPLVSVIITAYQHENYIRDCLESILYQTYSNIELIIVDDASKDRTPQIIHSYIKRLQEKCVNIECIFHEKNVGCVAKVLNEGIRKCTGEYIKALAGDDLMLPQFLEQSIAFCEKKSELLPDRDVKICICDTYIIGKHWHVGDEIDYGNTFYFRNNKYVYPSLHAYPQLTPEKMFRRLMVEGNYIPVTGAIVHKSIYQKYGLWNENDVLEDYEFWLRMAVKKVPIDYLDKCLVLYRKTSTGLSFAGNKETHFRSLKWSVRTRSLYLKYLPIKDRFEYVIPLYQKEKKCAKNNKWLVLYYVFFCHLLKFRIKQWRYKKGY